VNRQGGGEGRHEGSGQGIDGAQLAQGGGGAGARIDGAQDNEHGTNDRRRRKPYHAGADGGAEHVGGIVGAQRPAQEQAAGQEDDDGNFHAPPLTYCPWTLRRFA